MSKRIIDGIIHRLIIQNLLKAFKRVPRRYVVIHVVANPVHPKELMLLSVVCWVEREKLYTALLSSNPLFISHTKTFTKPERFQSHRLSVVSVLGCTWYTTLVILYILDSAFLVS